MEELLAAAASAMNAPEPMVERSARARAKATGESVEAVLAGWAGMEPPAGGAPPAVAPAPVAEAPAAAKAPAPAAKAAAVPPPAPEDAIGEALVVRLAAHLRKLPESMIRRSAEARAEASGSTYEAILAEWAGVPVEQVTAEPPAAAAAPTPAPAAEAPAAPAAAPAPAAAAAPADDAALLAAAAEKMGMPESMVKRSAGARAKAQNTTVEAVLAEWAGVEAPAGGGGGAAPAPAAATPAAAAVPVAAAAPEVEVLGEPDEVPSKPAATPDSDEFEPVEKAVAAGALPRWLAALFVFIPAFAIAYALFLPNGPNCGDAGSLAVDPVTGLAANCDLTEFGATVADFFSIGLETYNGIGCVACHGAGGGGVANFPAFTGGSLLTTFPEGQCSAQIEWISLGTAGWPDPTYGATAKPVGGSGAVMPGFAGTLTPEQIASVALYERVQFGGQALDAALTDCGLVTADAGTAAAGG